MLISNSDQRGGISSELQCLLAIRRGICHNSPPPAREVALGFLPVTKEWQMHALDFDRDPSVLRRIRPAIGVSYIAKM